MQVSLEKQPTLKMEASVTAPVWDSKLLFIISEIVAAWAKNLASQGENARHNNRELLLSNVQKLGSEMGLDEQTVEETVNVASISKKVLNRLAICEQKLPKCAPYLSLLREHLRAHPWNKKMKLGEPIQRNPQEKCADAVIQTIYEFMRINLDKKMLGNDKWAAKQKLISDLAKELGENLNYRKINKVVTAVNREKVKKKTQRTQDRINICIKIPEIKPYFEVIQSHYNAHPRSEF